MRKNIFSVGAHEHDLLFSRSPKRGTFWVAGIINEKTLPYKSARYTSPTPLMTLNSLTHQRLPRLEQCASLCCPFWDTFSQGMLLFCELWYTMNKFQRRSAPGFHQLARETNRATELQWRVRNCNSVYQWRHWEKRERGGGIAAGHSLSWLATAVYESTSRIGLFVLQSVQCRRRHRKDCR